jgi:hypothetical protein
MQLFDRWRLRFSLKGLLLAVAIIASLAAWYGHWLRVHENELRRFEGRWQSIRENGSPVTINGQPIVVEFKRGEFDVDPTREPRELDFYLSGAIDRAIYEWNDGKLRILQASSDLERPLSFDDDDNRRFRLKRGATSASSSLTEYLLERLPNP